MKKSTVKKKLQTLEAMKTVGTDFEKTERKCECVVMLSLNVCMLDIRVFTYASLFN